MGGAVDRVPHLPRLVALVCHHLHVPWTDAWDLEYAELLSAAEQALWLANPRGG